MKLLSCSILTAAALALLCASARGDEQRNKTGVPPGVITDQFGFKRGELKPTPDGNLDIKNNLGITVGHIRRLPNGSVVIQNKLGVKRGEIKPSRR